MATLWSKQVDGTHYEVRTAGDTRRLYTDGVFHSQFNPRRAWTGGVWDIMMLPAYFYPAGSIRRVLVLGVGGGAVIRQLHRYVQPESITGIEMNPVHLQVARKYFGIKPAMAELVEAEAMDWLRAYRGPRFDMIIEDLFGEDEGEPVRGIQPTAEWFRLLDKRLSKNGMLVMNFISPRELRCSAVMTDPQTRARFKSAFQFSLPRYVNAVGVFMKSDSSRAVFKRQVQAVPALDRAIRQNFIHFRLRELAP